MTQIKATLLTGVNHIETVSFPCSDDEIMRLTEQNEVGHKATVFINNLVGPKGLKSIEGTYANIHELNYLATAILFTSYKVLEAVYRQTKDRLTQYELIRMTRSNKSAIADFKKSKNGVLFASGSMWEGVDCIGDCLSSVIIPRLPFPMRSATMESKKEECNGLGEFVNTICVPEMLIKLRQGLGRLIRCETDTGLISILDTRATTGKYADKVGNVLAKYTKAETLDEVEAFFREVKSPAYFEV